MKKTVFPNLYRLLSVLNMSLAYQILNHIVEECPEGTHVTPLWKDTLWYDIHLNKYVKENQPRVSNELSLLRAMGLVRSVRDGKKVFYCANMEYLTPLRIMLSRAENSIIEVEPTDSVGVYSSVTMWTRILNRTAVKLIIEKLKTVNEMTVVDLFKAIAHEYNKTKKDLSDDRLSAVLMSLRQVELVKMEKRGKFHYYSLDKKVLGELEYFFTALEKVVTENMVEPAPKRAKRIRESKDKTTSLVIPEVAPKEGLVTNAYIQGKEIKKFTGTWEMSFPTKLEDPQPLEPFLPELPDQVTFLKEAERYEELIQFLSLRTPAEKEQIMKGLKHYLNKVENMLDSFPDVTIDPFKEEETFNWSLKSPDSAFFPETTAIVTSVEPLEEVDEEEPTEEYWEEVQFVDSLISKEKDSCKHPGVVADEMFTADSEMTIEKAMEVLNMDKGVFWDFLDGAVDVTPELAKKLHILFPETSVTFWIDTQTLYDKKNNK